MKVIDLHSDILTDVAFRRANGEMRVFERRHLSRLKESGIICLICVLWVEPQFKQTPYHRFMQLMEYAFEDLNECPGIEIVSTFDSIPSSIPKDKLYIILGIEGATFMQDWEGETENDRISRAIQNLSDQHFNHAILTWNETNFLASGAGSTNEDKTKGLTQAGQFAIKEMQKKHWIIDVSHMDETTFWDVIHYHDGPILASHSNAYSLCQAERNLTDRQLKEIVKRKGIIGTVACGDFVNPTEPTIEKFIDHIIYISDLIGTEHVAFGFDFYDFLDGHDLGGHQFKYIKGLENVTKVPELIDQMIKRGFNSKEIQQICYLNALRFLK